MESNDFSVAAFREQLANKRIMGSRCDDCQALHVPPRPICSACHARRMSWERLSEEGRIVGFTSVAIVPSRMAERGFGRSNPYVTAIVALEDGPSLMARIDGVDASEPGKSVHVGMRVRADFQEEAAAEEKGVTLVFKPA